MGGVSVSPTSPAPSVAATIRLLASAQKPATKGSPPYSVLVNRRLGRVLAAVAFRIGLTPNQVSLVSGAFTAAGLALIALVDPTVPVAVAVTLALVLGYGLDSADGQLARLRGGGSPAGEWLDHVLDSAKAGAVHLVVLIGWFRFHDLADAWLLLPLAYTVVDSVLFFATWITERMRRENGAGGPKPGEEPSRWDWVRKVLLLPTDYGVLTLVMLTLPFTTVFLVLYGGMFLGTALFALAALPKWFREITVLGAAPVSR
jgi:phosphatidylglycerophosphate synthase